MEVHRCSALPSLVAIEHPSTTFMSSASEGIKPLPFANNITCCPAPWHHMMLLSQPCAHVQLLNIMQRAQRAPCLLLCMHVQIFLAMCDVTYFSHCPVCLPTTSLYTRHRESRSEDVYRQFARHSPCLPGSMSTGMCLVGLMFGSALVTGSLHGLINRCCHAGTGIPVISRSCTCQVPTKHAQRAALVPGQSVLPVLSSHARTRSFDPRS